MSVIASEFEDSNSNAKQPLAANFKYFAADLLLETQQQNKLGVVGLERLLTVRDVAKLLKVNPATVYRLVEAGELPHVRVSNAIRFHAAAIAEFTR